MYNSVHGGPYNKVREQRLKYRKKKGAHSIALTGLQLTEISVCSCLLSSTPDSCGLLFAFIDREARQTFNKKIFFGRDSDGKYNIPRKSSLKSCVLLVYMSFPPPPSSPPYGRRVVYCSPRYLALYHLNYSIILTTTGD